MWAVLSSFGVPSHCTGTSRCSCSVNSRQVAGIHLEVLVPFGSRSVSVACLYETIDTKRGREHLAWRLILLWRSKASLLYHSHSFKPSQLPALKVNDGGLKPCRDTQDSIFEAGSWHAVRRGGRVRGSISSHFAFSCAPYLPFCCISDKARAAASAR